MAWHCFSDPYPTLPYRALSRRCRRSVLEVATEMSLRRTDAALLTKRGRVVGIITDHDLTRYNVFVFHLGRHAIGEVVCGDTVAKRCIASACTLSCLPP